MKWLKYVLSGLMVVLLTVSFIVSPDIYYQHMIQSEYQLKIRDIVIEESEQQLSANELFRAFYENFDSGLYSPVGNSKPKEDYLADCKRMINDLFGVDSLLAKMLVQRLDNNEGCTIQTEKFLMLFEGQAVVLNLVSVWIDNLYFYYIEDLDYAKGLDAMIQVSVYQTDDYYEQNEFSAALDKSAASIVEYYYSFGLKGGEFDYYAVYKDLDVWQLLVGLHTDIKAEY